MIGPENSRHFLNQSDSKLKSIATWSLLFSRASVRFLLLTLDSNWLLAIFSPFLTGCCDYFGFILRHYGNALYRYWHNMLTLGLQGVKLFREDILVKVIRSSKQIPASHFLPANIHFLARIRSRRQMFTKALYPTWSVGIIALTNFLVVLQLLVAYYVPNMHLHCAKFVRHKLVVVCGK